MHGGSHGGGVLTSVLMVSFDVVILTGIFGLVSYFVAPRILTGIEGDPLLIEDLEGRRAELQAELAEIGGKVDADVSDLIERKMRRHFFSLSYLIRQYTRREELTALLAKARLHFRNEMAAIEDKEKRGLALKALERMATLRRLDALIVLHRLLKIWVAPHVVSTSVMLVLMIVHVIQVIFFNVR
jgi:hypothetical protein